MFTIDVMHQDVTIIFPHQLFRQHPALEKERQIFIVEEKLFFNQYNFHKQKLVLHRASMQCYKNWLENKNYTVKYIEAHDPVSDARNLVKHLAEKYCKEIHVAEVIDDWLSRRLLSACQQHNIQLQVYQSPSFINSMKDANDFFDNKQRYFQTDFYIWQRKKYKLLLDVSDHPVGGKWSFDSENRKRFPKNEIAPALHLPKQNKYVSEARTYVEQHYTNNYGSNKDPFYNTNGFFPVTFTESEQWLDDFIQYRFKKFGVYEDAIIAKEQVLHHSVLSSSLNIGILTPKQVIDAVIENAYKHNIPLNSLEGFIRQIIGWREYIRIVYEREGRKQRTKNYWNFTRKIPISFWNGTTGIEPIDAVIKKVLQSAYTHHIERLMVLGNFMLLCEFNPDEVYKWFMELFIDAYDWVMVPNVYGMTQFADGGIMSTKPYISSSNYLIKMSDFKKGKWQQTWDALFWRFMHVHRDFFKSNQRIGMLLTTFDKMSEEKKASYLDTAENFLRSLDSSFDHQLRAKDAEQS